MDISKYAALFLAESREHLSACNQLLLEWERDPERLEPVGGLFRSIHTIKGMGATMGYAGVADLAHRMENLLDALRQGRVMARAGNISAALSRGGRARPGGRSAAAGRGEARATARLAAELDAEAAARRSSMRQPAAAAAARHEARRATARPARVRCRSPCAAMRVMRGARAALVVRRAESLGPVTALRPALAQLDREDFDGRLSFALDTEASDERSRRSSAPRATSNRFASSRPPPAEAERAGAGVGRSGWISGDSTR